MAKTDISSSTDADHDFSHGIVPAHEAAEKAARRRQERQEDEPGLIRRLAIEHGLNEPTVMEIIGDIEAETGNTEQMALASQYRAMKDWMHDALHLIRRTLQNQKTTHPDSLRTLDTACLAMGFTDVCEAREAAELARKYGVPKETVNKPKLEFQKKVAMPPAPGQRTEQQREGFAAKRIEKIQERQAQAEVS